MDSVSMEIYQVFFVLESGKTEKTASRAMKDAFAQIEEENSLPIQPLWMTTAEVLKFDSSQPTLFVCDPFQGKAFDHLSKSGRQIVGPLCLESCLIKGEGLPTRPHPVYSTCMRRLMVTCSGLDNKLRVDLVRKIQFMCGGYLKDLTQSVTHVVACEVRTKKYKAAAEHNIPIMLPEWVEQCWEVEQYKKRHATDQWHSKFVCPPFKGLVISISQLEADERKKVQKLVQENGGTFSGPVRAKETTHILLFRPEGDKYKFAQVWKLFCISPAWLYDSIKAGYCLNEEKYRVSESDLRERCSSTPEKGQGPSTLNLNDCSAITNASFRSRIDDTVMSDVSLLPPKCTVANPLDTFNINIIPKDCQFLDGCRIFLYGFTGSHLEKVQRIINAGGGTRYSKLLDSVTHIVLKDKSNVSSLPVNRNEGAHVVTFHWLLACCQKLTLVDETEYLCVTKAPFSPTNSPSTPKFTVDSTKMEMKTSDSTVHGLTTNGSIDYDALMEQYMPQKAELLDAKECGDNTTNSETKVCNDKSAKIETTTDIPGETMVIPLFYGVTFSVVGFEETTSETLVDLLKNYGGIVCGQEEKTEYAVVPLLCNLTVPTAKTVVTNCWLQRCFEEEVVLDVDTNPLFKPFSLKPNCTPLVNCVLSISQFTGTERDSLKHLAEVLGATCQEYLVRFPKKDKHLLPNTHLVLQQSKGDKYQAAKKWNIPAVSKFWLIETAMTGMKAKEEDFLVDAVKENSVLARDEQDGTRSVTVDESNKNLSDETSLLNKSKNPVQQKTESVGDKEKPGPANSRQEENTNGKSGFDQEKSASNKVLENNRVRKLIEDECGNTSQDFLNQNSKFKPRFDLDGVLSSFDSPASQSSKKRSLGIDELLTVQLKLATQNLGVDRSYSEYVPLAGVVLYVAKKLSHLQGPLNRLCGDLGGDYRWSYDKSCTHFVFQGKAGEANLSKELRVAREHGKKIVSPEWLYACRDEEKRVDEALFPFTYNPRFDLSSQLANISTNNNFEESEANLSDCKSEALESTTNQSEEQDSTTNQSEEQDSMSSAQLLDVSKHLKELMTATTSAKVERRRTRRTNSSSGSPSPADSASKNKVHHHFYPRQAEPEPQPSQSVPITWDDPMGRLEQEKIAEQLSHCPETQNTQSQSDETDEIETKNFIFSGLKDSEKKLFTAVVIRLGGNMLNTKIYDPSTTHLVIGSLLKNEKFLSTVAAGKWVLRKSYLVECDREDRFVDEESHEWGGPSGASETEVVKDLALCPRRWRLHVAQTQMLAFHDWRVVIFCESSSKRDTFQRILEAGGAVVLPSLCPYDPSLGATYAIIDSFKNTDAETIDYSGLEAAGVKCVKAEYLAIFLVDRNPQLDRYLINQSANNLSLTRKRKTERQAKSPKRSRS